MKRTLDCGIWQDPKVRGLDVDGKLLFAYLIANPHSHVSGLYWCPPHYMAHELGLPLKRVEKALGALAESGLVAFDPEREVVWVVSMAGKQAYAPNVWKSCASHVATLHGSPLIEGWIERYKDRTDAIANLSAMYTEPIQEVPQGTYTQSLSVPVPDPDTDTQSLSVPVPLPEPVGGVPRKVFDVWVGTMGRKGARLTAKRVKLIKARLKEGYSEQDLIDAVVGCSKSPFHMGENARNTRYDSLELIARDGDHVEDFGRIARGEVTPQSNGKASVGARMAAKRDEALERMKQHGNSR